MAKAATLERAITGRQWEAAALCLLVAAAEAANRLPPQTLAEMLQLLSAETETQAPRGKER